MSDEIKLGFTIDNSQAGRALVELMQSQAKYDEALLKSVGITREQAKANKQLIDEHRQAHELAMTFKAQEIRQIDAYKKALIEEGQLDTRIAREKREADEKQTAAFVANRSKERASWRSFVSEVKSLNTNPLEAFAARQERLNTALKAGAISQQDFNRETARMHAELNPAIQETTKSAFSFNDAMVAAGTAGAIYSLVRQQIDGVKESLRGAREEAQKALNDAKGQVVGDSQLLEVARGSTDVEQSADLNRMRGTAASLASKYGLTLEEAKGVVYHGRNLGNETAADFEAIAATSAITKNTQQVALMGGTMKNTFSRENLSTAQIMEGVAAGSRHGPSSMKDYAENLGPATVMGESLGFKFADEVSVYSALVSAFGGNAKMAADRQNTLQQRIRRHRDDLGNPKTLMDAIDSMRKMEVERPDLFEKDIEGRAESMQVYEALRNSKYQQIVKETRADVDSSMASAGMPGSALSTKLRVRDADPILGGLSRMAASQAGLQLAEQRLVPREAANESAVNLAKKALLNQTGLIGPYRQRAYGFMEKVREWAGFDGSPVTPEGIGFSGVTAGAVYGGGMNPFNPKSRAAGKAAVGAGKEYLNDIDHKTPSEQLEKTNSLLQTLIDRLPQALQSRAARAAAQGQALLQAN